MTYIAVPIAAQNFRTACEQIEHAKNLGAELIELRCDYLIELSTDSVNELIKFVHGQGLPVIVTCRDSSQGGARGWDAQIRVAILAGAITAGADFVDCEYRNYITPEFRGPIDNALAMQGKTRLIVSEHDFQKPFKNLQTLYDVIRADCPSAIPKLVYTANHINDCFDAFDLLHSKDSDVIVFAMGEAGLISRVLAKKLGSLVTFACLSQGSSTAAGQITIEEFNGKFRYSIINEHTELFGVIASPVKHSYSPAIHNACFSKLQMNKLYLPLLVTGERTNFNEFMDNVMTRPWLDFKGFSVTLPHKENAIEYVEHTGGFIEPLAVKIGAVNTLVIGLDRRASGYNSDYTGAMHAITSVLGSREKLHGLHAAVIGAGGVSRAIVAALVDAGAHVTIYNRTVAKAKQLATEFGCAYKPLQEIVDAKAELLVNCTNIGMHPLVDFSPVDEGVIHAGMIVFDTVYNPMHTKLLTQSKAQGAQTIDGVTMFVNQALAQFKLFTSQEGDGELMRKVVFNCLCINCAV